MKELLKIALLCLFLGAFAACEGDEDFDPVKQQDTFLEFFEENELEYDEDLALQYIFKMQLPDSLYKDMDNPPPVGDVVQSGDRISIYYAGYLFSSGATNPETKYGRGDLFTTNIRQYSDSESVGWPENPNTEPMALTVGSSRLSGLNIGIPGSRVGEGFLLYLSADYAYGSDEVGFLEKGSAVVYEIYIMGKE